MYRSVLVSERPEGPKYVSPGQSEGAKPRSAALGKRPPHRKKSPEGAPPGLKMNYGRSCNVPTLKTIGIEVRFRSNPRAALRSALGWHVSAFQAFQTGKRKSFRLMPERTANAGRSDVTDLALGSWSVVIPTGTSRTTPGENLGRNPQKGQLLSWCVLWFPSSNLETLGLPSAA